MLVVRRLTAIAARIFGMIGNAGKPRIYAFIIDNLVATIMAFILVALFGSKGSLVSGIALCLTYLLYYLVFEVSLSRTPGKIAQGLEVRKLDGSRCDFKSALIRTSLRI